MKMKFQKNKNGFTVLVLDILFIAAGVTLLIIGLLRNKDILSAMLGK